MKYIVLIAFFGLLSSDSISQKVINTDSLVVEICKTVKVESLQNDSLTLLNCLQKHLFQYTKQISKEACQELFEKCYLRLQRECPDFKNLLVKISPPKGDWKKVYVEPESNISKSDCILFFKISKYFYFESNGDTATVVITDSTWTDSFKDKTYSKLSLEKKNDCDFQIIFIESNNLLRKNFSKVGDRYRYKILQKFDTYYEMYTEIPGTPQKETFRLYY